MSTSESKSGMLTSRPEAKQVEEKPEVYMNFFD
jgi:hypothetical protein